MTKTRRLPGRPATTNHSTPTILPGVPDEQLWPVRITTHAAGRGRERWQLDPAAMRAEIMAALAAGRVSAVPPGGRRPDPSCLFASTGGRLYVLAATDKAFTCVTVKRAAA